MRNPLHSIDARWRNCICFILVGAIFVLSQFVAATPPVRDDGKVIRAADTLPLDQTHGTDND